MKLKFSLTLLAALLTLTAPAAQPLAPADLKALEALALNTTKPAESRIAALWTLEKTGKLNADALTKLIGDASPAVRKNALKLVGALHPKVMRHTIKHVRRSTCKNLEWIPYRGTV